MNLVLYIFHYFKLHISSYKCTPCTLCNTNISWSLTKATCTHDVHVHVYIRCDILNSRTENFLAANTEVPGLVTRVRSPNYLSLKVWLKQARFSTSHTAQIGDLNQSLDLRIFDNSTPGLNYFPIGMKISLSRQVFLATNCRFNYGEMLDHLPAKCWTIWSICHLDWTCYMYVFGESKILDRSTNIWLKNLKLQSEDISQPSALYNW